ncbi:MAG: DUF4189 domain-containing protein [Stenotrophomonas geniculata]
MPSRLLPRGGTRGNGGRTNSRRGVWWRRPAVSTSSSAPTGEWIKTWGGIAVSASTSDAGVSTGHRSKKEAERKAVSECAASGASDCKVSMTYFNQCVSWVIPSGRTGNGLSGIGTGPTPGDAERAAQGVCKNDKPGACAPVYANCTEPLFRNY